MGSPVVIGVDSSTQSCKVELRRLGDGKIVGFGSAPHPTTSPPTSEQDPNRWWAALVEAFDQIRSDDPSALADAVAIAIGGQQHGLVLLDEAGQVLRPAKLWNDTTSAPQAKALVAALGAERWAQLAGSVPVPAFTITKLAWVADHDPDLLDRTAMVMLPHDYLTWRLSGEHVTDRGDASGTGWCQPTTGAYEPTLLDAAGVDGSLWLDKLPRVLQWREAAGTVRPDVASELGLPDGVAVGPGTGDNMAAALGIGLGEGDAAISLGTSGTAYARSATPTHDVSGAVAGFASATGDFLPLVCTLNATKVTDTVARWLGTDPAGLSELALEASSDPAAVMMVPYFDGERTPNLPDARGSLVGLTNATTPAQIALAAHDSVLCGLLDGVDALADVGATLGGSIALVGGGARSRAYRQRLADLMFRPVLVPSVAEAVATGAAAQAALVFELSDPADVIDRWGLDDGEVIEPERDARHRRQRYEIALKTEESGVVD